MTDNEIIKALECCSKDGLLTCRNCPYEESCNMGRSDMQKDALDLISRLNAEIERLEKYNTDVAYKHYNDGIKEFAERFKNSMVIKLDRRFYSPIIDNMVKEMTGEQNDKS